MFCAAMTLALMPVLVTGHVDESNCDAQWTPTFGGMPGIGGTVYSMCEYDEGTDSSLLVGGWFSSAGGEPTSGVVRWDGTDWSSIGPPPHEVFSDRHDSMIVFNDGTGDALYVGITRIFSVNSGVTYAVIRWDGSDWTDVGEPFDGRIMTLAVFDDGNGPALYAGGAFEMVGALPVTGVAKWDGAVWQPVGGGLQGEPAVRVDSMATYGEVPNQRLVVAGGFQTAGEIAASNIAMWDGASWTAAGSGFDEPVRSLAVVHEPDGATLYATGDFDTVNGVSSFIGRWEDNAWQSVDTEALQGVITMTGFGPPGNQSLIISGWADGKKIMRRDPAGWSQIGSVTGYSASVLGTMTNVATGATELVAAGDYWYMDGRRVESIARWDGEEWHGFEEGMDHAVFALHTFDDGCGEALYAGGYLDDLGDGVSVNGLGRWDGDTWEPIAPSDMTVLAMATIDFGDAPRLAVGGSFFEEHGAPGNNVALWDGDKWSSLGDGVNGPVWSLAQFDDGVGRALYVGGEFEDAAGVAVNNIARWDGQAWSALPPLTDCPFGATCDEVNAMAVFDDGTGPALYVGGLFLHAGGTLVNNIAKWDGQSWSALGSGVSSRVSALAVFDDGSGPALFAAGRFERAGEENVNLIAKWDGESWSDLAGGLGQVCSVCRVKTLEVFDDGTGNGPALYAAGAFGLPDESEPSGYIQNIARWDGSGWTSVGSNEYLFDTYTMCTFTPLASDRAGLFVGGFFQTSAAGDSYLAHWEGCSRTEPPLPADVDGSGVVDVWDMVAVLINWGCVACDCDGDANEDGEVNLADLLAVIGHWGQSV